MEKYDGKESVDEYALLKDRIIAIKGELLEANKRIRELEPAVKQVIINTHAKAGGSQKSQSFPVLLFTVKKKVIELKRRKRTPTLNVKILANALNDYLVSRSLTRSDVSDFITFLKLARKDTRTEADVLHYRAATLSELDVTVPEGAPMDVDDDGPVASIIQDGEAVGFGAVSL